MNPELLLAEAVIRTCHKALQRCEAGPAQEVAALLLQVIKIQQQQLQALDEAQLETVRQICREQPPNTAVGIEQLADNALESLCKPDPRDRAVIMHALRRAQTLERDRLIHMFTGKAEWAWIIERIEGASS
jgi:hypothetical protein